MGHFGGSSLGVMPGIDGVSYSDGGDDGLLGGEDVGCVSLFQLSRAAAPGELECLAREAEEGGTLQVTVGCALISFANTRIVLPLECPFPATKHNKGANFRMEGGSNDELVIGDVCLMHQTVCPATFLLSSLMYKLRAICSAERERFDQGNLDRGRLAMGMH